MNGVPADQVTVVPHGAAIYIDGQRNQIAMAEDKRFIIWIVTFSTEKWNQNLRGFFNGINSTPPLPLPPPPPSPRPPRTKEIDGSLHIEFPVHRVGAKLESVKSKILYYPLKEIKALASPIYKLLQKGHHWQLPRPFYENHAHLSMRPGDVNPSGNNCLMNVKYNFLYITYIFFCSQEANIIYMCVCVS